MHGYDPTLMHGNTPAFFPLYPMLLGAAHRSCRAPTWPARRRPLDRSSRWRCACSTGSRASGSARRWRRPAILYLAISPLAFIFSTVYAESLFLLLAVARSCCSSGAASCWRRRRRAGAAGRPVGIMLAPAFAYRISRERRPPARPAPSAAAGRCCCCPRPSSASCSTCGGAPATRSPRCTPRRAAGARRGVPAGADGADLHRARCCRRTSCATCAPRFVLLWLGLLVVLFRRGATGCRWSTGSSPPASSPCPSRPARCSRPAADGLMGFPLFWALAMLGRRETVTRR